jgi:hypothetical protein
MVDTPSSFERTEQIYTAMGAVLHDLEDRATDDIYDVLGHLLARHGVFMLPKVVEMESEERLTRHGMALFRTRVVVDYDFVSSADQSKVTARTVGEAFDPGDKSIDKALDVAYKHALTQTFLIPASEPVVDTANAEVIPKDDSYVRELPAYRLVRRAKKEGVDPKLLANILGVIRFDTEKINMIVHRPGIIETAVEKLKTRSNAWKPKKTRA